MKKNAGGKTIAARYVGNSKGFGFAVTEDESDDFYIASEDANGAIDGDIIIVKPIMQRGRRAGKVVDIVEHAVKQIVGIYSGGSVNSDNKRLSAPFIVPRNRTCGALDGQKVVAVITRYPSAFESGECAISEILGFPSDFGVDVLSIIRSYGIETEFPQEVIKESEKVPKNVSAGDIEQRLDLREETVITIDGADTKDIDDAVSVSRTLHGWKLGVHIADVSHYVKPQTALDGEAMARGNSVYLTDRVIPMLPPRLSNGICSLNEDVDRLTMSVIMEIDRDGEVLEYSLTPSVIHSAKRMTYDQVYALLEGEGDSPLLPMLSDMKELYLCLKEASKTRGCIDFTIPEAYAVLDEDGCAVDIRLREHNYAHEIIEEFMVIANRTVAQFLAQKDVFSVFRIHEEPTMAKIETFAKMAFNMGYKLPPYPMSPKALSAFLESINGDKGEGVLRVMALRSMMKAAYAPQNCGHYGLAAPYYCHFTSPIRRYADLCIHRALKAVLSGDITALKYLEAQSTAVSKNVSEREVAAERAERDTLDLKKAEYMQAHIGETFEGRISSVLSFGFFVELPNTIEGLVRAENIKDDYYEFDERSMTLTGTRRGKRYSLCDTLRVVVVAASRESGQIDFIPEDVYNGKEYKSGGTKQKSTPRVFHRGRVRNGNRAYGNRSKKRKKRQGQS
ncbi:MAG: ribonuclease R [Clostridia bacterium]|nr:ribonuclease R [Clostridia bacterium]